MSSDDSVVSQPLSCRSDTSTLPSISGSVRCAKKAEATPVRKPARTSSVPSLRAKPPADKTAHSGGKATKSVLAEGGVLKMDPEKCLIQAALRNDIRSIKLLAVQDRRGLKQHVDYALFYAIKAGSYDAVKLLLKHGANLDAKYIYGGHTVWDFAKQSPDPEIMKALLQSLKTGAMAHDDIRMHFSGAGGPSKELLQSIQRPSTPSTIVRRGSKGLRRNLRTISTI